MPTIPHIHIKIVHSRKRLRVAPRSCARRFLVNGSLRRAPHRKFSHHRGLSEDLPGRHGLYGRSVGATLVGSLYGALVAATPKDNSKRAWAKTERRWASGKRQINRRGHRSTQGHLRPGAPQGEDARWSFGPLGGQDGGLHLAGSGSTTSSGERSATWP